MIFVARCSGVLVCAYTCVYPDEGFYSMAIVGVVRNVAGFINYILLCDKF